MFTYKVIAFIGTMPWQSPEGYQLNPEQACNYWGSKGGELVSTAVHGDTLLLFIKHREA